MNRLLLFIPAVLFVFSCGQEKKNKPVLEKQEQVVVQKENDELKLLPPGSVKIFKAKEIGWTTRLPEGWNIRVSDDSTRENTRRKKESSKSFEIKGPDFEPLLSVRKNTFNSFLSHIRKIDGANDGTYEERTTAMFNKLKNTYRVRGVQIKETIGAQLIDGIMFDRLELELPGPVSSNNMLFQAVYSAHINGYDFSMLITYDNSRDGDELLAMVTNSEFYTKK